MRCPVSMWKVQLEALLFLHGDGCICSISGR